MASFDMIDAAGRSYRLVWQERHYLAQLAAVPILIKLLTYIIITRMGWEEHFLRQAIVFLPSYLADGWMLAHFVRLILLDQRWPFRPSGRPEADRAALRDRADGVLAGTVAHALIKFLLAGGIGLIVMAGLAAPAPGTGAGTGAGTGTSLAGAMALLAVTGAGLWAFRLIWLYIPVTVGYAVRRILRDMGGYVTSFRLLGLWLVCCLPMFMLVRFVSALIVAPYGPGAGAMPLVTSMILGFLYVMLSTVNVFLTTAGMTFAMRAMTEKARRGRG